MNPDPASVAVGYVRVSSDSQADNASLPAQREAIIKYCARKDLKLFAIFSDVQSGEDASNRDGFQKALSALYAGIGTYLVVHKLDRFSRNVLDSEQVKEELKAKGKKLVGVAEEIETATKDGELLFHMKTIFAAMERKAINRRCSMGRARKRSHGGYIGGAPPFGWDAIGRELVVNADQQKVLREIFEMRERGLTLAAISFDLNSRGIKTKRGTAWSPGPVQSILLGFPEMLERRGIMPDWMKEKLGNKESRQCQ
ncbi:MAG: recombinase family protein [Cyanobacteria bacterium SZAS LIN-3]|nr:recombinase family protein [Cyanobacteria bacterium SZAS LIN-3]